MSDNRNWSDRYPENWPEISRQCRESTGHRCCLCQNEATQTHHALYVYSNGQIISDFRGIGSYLFPLCKSCHELAHHSYNYKKCPHNPVLGNKNTARFWEKLRKGWLAKKNKT